jgi:hypothetical protein
MPTPFKYPRRSLSYLHAPLQENFQAVCLPQLLLYHIKVKER